METGGVVTEQAIPVLKVEGDTIPEVWENAVLKCWREGIGIRTEYDKEGDHMECEERPCGQRSSVSPAALVQIDRG